MGTDEWKTCHSWGLCLQAVKRGSRKEWELGDCCLRAVHGGFSELEGGSPNLESAQT